MQKRLTVEARWVGSDVAIFGRNRRTGCVHECKVPSVGHPVEFGSWQIADYPFCMKTRHKEAVLFRFVDRSGDPDFGERLGAENYPRWDKCHNCPHPGVDQRWN